MEPPAHISGDDTTWHSKALQAWLLALLRLAVTGDRADRLEVMATARALDALGAPDLRISEFPAFRFFHTTSVGLCRAMTDPMHPGRNNILRQHIARIEDRRLKHAFATAVAIDHPTSEPAVTTESHMRNTLSR